MRSTEMMTKFPHLGQASDKHLTHEPPDFRHEDWKYTHFPQFQQYTIQLPSALSQGDRTSNSVPTIPLEDDTWIVVVKNGVIQPHLSQLPDPSSGISIRSLTEADVQHSEEPGLPFGALAMKHGHYFSQWAMAQHAAGLFIDVKKDVVAQKPLLIQTINEITEAKQVLPCHHVVRLAPHSSLTLSEILEGDGAGMSLAVYEIHVGIGANLKHNQLQLWANSQECIQQVLVAQERESQYAHFVYCSGGKKVRNQLTVSQEGQMAHTELTGLVLPGRNEHLDNQTLMRHISPNCSSRQRYRSLIGHEGTSVFNGKVYVDPDAQKTDAYQHHASLLMHESAVSNAKPELEIYADDVKCSHGATTGMLDAGEVHYMRSRGLSEIQARLMLQEAFVRDLLESLPVESLRSWCINHCVERLHDLNRLTD